MNSLDFLDLGTVKYLRYFSRGQAGPCVQFLHKTVYFYNNVARARDGTYNNNIVTRTLLSLVFPACISKGLYHMSSFV